MFCKEDSTTILIWIESRIDAVEAREVIEREREDHWIYEIAIRKQFVTVENDQNFDIAIRMLRMVNCSKMSQF